MVEVGGSRKVFQVRAGSSELPDSSSFALWQPSTGHFHSEVLHTPCSVSDSCKKLCYCQASIASLLLLQYLIFYSLYKIGPFALSGPFLTIHDGKGAKNAFVKACSSFAYTT